MLDELGLAVINEGPSAHLGALGFSVERDIQPSIGIRAALTNGSIFKMSEGKSRRETTDKRSAVGMRIVRTQPVFEKNLVHSGWQNCFVSCAVSSAFNDVLVTF